MVAELLPALGVMSVSFSQLQESQECSCEREAGSLMLYSYRLLPVSFWWDWFFYFAFCKKTERWTWLGLNPQLLTKLQWYCGSPSGAVNGRELFIDWLWNFLSNRGWKELSLHCWKYPPQASGLALIPVTMEFFSSFTVSVLFSFTTWFMVGDRSWIFTNPVVYYILFWC